MSSGDRLEPGPVVRRAALSDLSNIFYLIESMTGDGTLLRRTKREIEEHLDTFVVAESDTGEFLGCAALHRYGPHLAEIRSIAVKPEARGLGAGGMLLEKLLRDIENTGTGCACLFTRLPSFFAHYGFHAVSLSSIPDEVAMARGELPASASATLAAAADAHELVQL